MTDSKTLFEVLKLFLEESEASRTASKPLKNGIEIGIRFAGSDDDYHVIKEEGRLMVKAGAARAPDWTAVISSGAVHSIKAMPDPDLGDLGVMVLKLMAKGVNDPHSEDHIKVHLTAGFFTILRHGYLGILPLGGPKVGKFLAQHGLKNISGIKRVFKKLRGTED